MFFVLFSKCYLMMFLRFKPVLQQFFPIPKGTGLTHQNVVLGLSNKQFLDDNLSVLALFYRD